MNVPSPPFSETAPWAGAGETEAAGDLVAGERHRHDEATHVARVEALAADIFDKPCALAGVAVRLIREMKARRSAEAECGRCAEPSHQQPPLRTVARALILPPLVRGVGERRDFWRKPIAITKSSTVTGAKSSRSRMNRR